jgi:hypothetical protein
MRHCFVIQSFVNQFTAETLPIFHLVGCKKVWCAELSYLHMIRVDEGKQRVLA